jgi:Ca2+-transporting ATPase
MRRPPRPPSESILGRGLWQHVLGFGVLTAAVTLVLGVWEYRHDGPWQTMVLTTLAMLQLGNSLAARAETTSTFRLGFRTNPFLLATVLGTVAVQIAVIYWSPLQNALDTEALDLSHLLVALLASTVTFWAIEAEKLVRRRHAVRR